MTVRAGRLVAPGSAVNFLAGKGKRMSKAKIFVRKVPDGYEYVRTEPESMAKFVTTADNRYIAVREHVYDMYAQTLPGSPVDWEFVITDEQVRRGPGRPRKEGQ